MILSLVRPSTCLHELKRIIRISGVGIDLLLKHVAHIDKTRGESERRYRGEEERKGGGRTREREKQEEGGRRQRDEKGK